MVNSTFRQYSSNRSAIVGSIVALLKTIDSKTSAGEDGFTSRLNDAVLPKLVVWDHITNYPTVCVSAAEESIKYHPSRLKERNLNVNIRIFVNSNEDPMSELENIIADIETILETNSGLMYKDRYGVDRRISEISVVSVNTDEGVLSPLGIGEISLNILYN